MRAWLLFLCVPAFGAVYSVCSSGCTGTDLQTVYNAAACGDIINQTAGYTVTESGGFVINKNCGSNYILIRTNKAYALPAGRVCAQSGQYPGCAIDGANMAILRTTNTTDPVITATQGSSGVIFRGFDIGTPGQNPYSIVNLFYQIGGSDGDSQQTQLPHHIWFDQDYIHSDNSAANTNQNKGISANSGTFYLTNSFVFAYTPYSDGTHYVQGIALGGWNTRGPVYVRNNTLTSGNITTIFGGATPSISGLRVTGYFVQGNYYYRPWYFRVQSGSSNPSGTCLWDLNGGESFNQTSSGHWWKCVSGTWTDQGAGTSPQYPTNDINHFELKDASSVVVDGNIMANEWYPTGDNQRGACFLENQVDNYVPAGVTEPEAQVSFVSIQNNVCRHAPWIYSEGSLNTYYYPNHDNRFINNLGVDIAADPETWPNALFPASTSGVALESANFLTEQFNSNTIILNPSSTGVTGSSMLLNGPAVNYQLVGNIINISAWGFYNTNGGGNTCEAFAGYSPSTIGWDMPSRSVGLDVIVNDQTTLYAGYPLSQIEFATIYNVPPVSSCQQQVGNPPMTGPSNFLSPSWSNVNFVNFQAAGGGDYHLSSGSPYKGKGPYGQDPGADEDIVNWSTANVVSGLPNPYLDFNVLALRWTSTTASLRFLAYDSTDCTVNVYPNPNRTSATFTATDSGGDRDRTVSVTGLTTTTRYWYDVLCSAANYRRSGVFITQ